jgi:PAS domain-containing protein
VPDPRDAVPEVPAACADIVRRAMAKRPGDRYPTAEHMLAALQAAFPAILSPGTSTEAARLAALRRYGILDTESERVFDDFAALAARICGTPISAISLIDERRQWIKARVGVDVRETPREVAFCSHTILGTEILVVPDATADARFAANPFVAGEARIRFYAGAPLINPDGFALGALCVVDRTPRTLTAEQADALRILARQVVAQMELRLNIAERRLVEERLARFEGVLEATPDFVGMADVQGRAMYVNRAGRLLAGLPDGAAPADRSIADFHPGWAAKRVAEVGLPAALRDGVWEGASALLAPDGREIPCSQVILAHRSADGTVTHFSTIMRPVPISPRE